MSTSLRTKLNQVNACQIVWTDSRKRTIQPAFSHSEEADAIASAVAYAENKLSKRVMEYDAKYLVRIMIARGLMAYPDTAQKWERHEAMA